MRYDNPNAQRREFDKQWFDIYKVLVWKFQKDILAAIGKGEYFISLEQLTYPFVRPDVSAGYYDKRNIVTFQFFIKDGDRLSDLYGFVATVEPAQLMRCRYDSGYPIVNQSQAQGKRIRHCGWAVINSRQAVAVDIDILMLAEPLRAILFTFLQTVIDRRYHSLT